MNTLVKSYFRTTSAYIYSLVRELAYLQNSRQILKSIIILSIYSSHPASNDWDDYYIACYFTNFFPRHHNVNIGQILRMLLCKEMHKLVTIANGDYVGTLKTNHYVHTTLSMVVYMAEKPSHGKPAIAWNTGTIAHRDMRYFVVSIYHRNSK